MALQATKLEIHKTKLEIHNTYSNCETKITYEWYFCYTDEERERWISEKEKEHKEFDLMLKPLYEYAYLKPSRYFTTYQIEELVELDIVELKGMLLKDLIKIMNVYGKKGR
jgi:hypothetical protein